jgi:hypothetical protein
MKNFTFKLVAVSAIVLFSVTALPHPQQKRRPFCGFSLRNGYYYQAEEQQYITREAKKGDKSGIPDVVEKIEAKIGIDVPIAVYIAKDENNCFATILEGGKRVLIADQLFLVEVNKGAGTQWAAISIVAHEIGHHIAGFSRRATQGESELDADYWSGYALYKLGASENASVKAIMVYGTEKDTDSHPNKYSRSQAIKKGWDDAKRGDYDKDRCESCGV